MSDDQLLDELLARWEDDFDRGHDLSPEELCRDTPHLVERVAQEIAKLKRLRPASANEPPIPIPTQPMGPPPPPMKAFAGLRFEPRRYLGSDGQGDLFVALDQEVGREVALKRMQAWHADEPDIQTRFEREAEITGRLEHPGVVPLYGRGRDADGRPFYAMRFIRGRNLRIAIEEYHKAENTKKDPSERAVAFRGLLQSFVVVCQTVAYAHSRGVIHRDLKPANLMLGPYGETLVIDWGMAKYVGRDEPHRDPAEESLRTKAVGDANATPSGAALGTPAFISPEQALGRKDVGPASDVFSLGATLYQLLTGRPPYQGWQALVDAAAGKFPRPRQVRRDVPPALEAVCLKAMAHRPEDRYATAQELARDVDRWLADEPTTAYREPWRVQTWRWVKRHRTPVAATAAALLAAALLVGGGLWWKVDQDARAAQRVQDALAEFSRLGGQGQWQEAHIPLDRAVQLESSVPASLQQRVRQAKTDLDLMDWLEGLSIRVWESELDSTKLGRADPAEVDRELAAAFQDYGVELDASDPKEPAARIRDSAIREPLVEALDHWLYLKALHKIDGGKSLIAVLQLADANALRRQCRTLTVQGDRAALEKLAGDKELLAQAPAPALATLALALVRAGGKEAGIKLLRLAQVKNAGDFAINLQLSVVLDWAANGSPSDESIAFFRAALAIRPRNPELHAILGEMLGLQGKLAEAETECRYAVELKPDDETFHYSLGSVLSNTQSRWAESEAELRRALELKPDYAEAHNNLGFVLDVPGKRTEAEAEIRRAVDLKPDYAEANYNLGIILLGKGRLADAEAEFRHAIKPKDDYPKAHVALGLVLGDQGKFDDGLDSLQHALKLLPPTDSLRSVAEAGISQCKRAQNLSKKLPAVLKGEVQVGAAERIEFARLCQYKQRNAAAVCLYMEAFTQQPGLADDLGARNRLHASWAAALAGAGQGEDASGLDDNERARLRSEALVWLRADLTAWDKRRQDDPKARPLIQKTLQEWQDYADLAGVRDTDALAKLPEAERVEWKKLWADVDALLMKVGDPK